MKLPYSEGIVFLVPLRDGGYARGVAARTSPQGKGVFGYFFGPKLTSVDDATIDDLIPFKAILHVRFGDLGLIKGTWPIYGKLTGWDRSMWPMPDFVRRDPLGKRKPVLVRYVDNDPMRIETEYPIDDATGMEADSAWGYGAVEIKLTKLLEHH